MRHATFSLLLQELLQRSSGLDGGRYSRLRVAHRSCQLPFSSSVSSDIPSMFGIESSRSRGQDALARGVGSLSTSVLIFFQYSSAESLGVVAVVVAVVAKPHC